MARITLLLLLIFNTLANGQNLVPNPSFEDINGTIDYYANDCLQFNRMFNDWNAVTSSTPDLLTPDFYDQFLELSKPHSGKNMIGIQSRWDNFRKENFWSEYIGVKLKEDLMPKRTYYFEYWIKWAITKNPKMNNNENMHSNFGILFYLDTLLLRDSKIIHAEIQVKADSNLVTTNTEWTKVSGYFTPESRYNKICLGQFYKTTDYDTTIMRNYYQIDDVLIEELKGFAAFDKTAKITKGTIIPLNEIQFETGTTKLSHKKSHAQLKELVTYLKANPSMRVRVNGHTDFVGTKESNLTLSNKRAEFIAQYIIERGIDKARIEWKGFGDASPIDNNETTKGRARNRRVEFEVIDSQY